MRIMFSNIIALTLGIKKQQLYLVKDTTLFDFEFLIPSTYNIAKYDFSIFVAIAIAVFCVQLIKQLLLYIYKEVSGAFSGIAYFLNNILCAWFCFSKKIVCGHPPHYKLVKMFSLYIEIDEVSQNSLLISFSTYFLQCFLCISHVPAVFCIKRVLTNFAKFTENT